MIFNKRNQKPNKENIKFSFKLSIVLTILFILLLVNSFTNNDSVTWSLIMSRIFMGLCIISLDVISIYKYYYLKRNQRADYFINEKTERITTYLSLIAGAIGYVTTYLH